MRIWKTVRKVALPLVVMHIEIGEVKAYEMA